METNYPESLIEATKIAQAEYEEAAAVAPASPPALSAADLTALVVWLADRIEMIEGAL
ncbi:hypothetical protein ACTJJ4_03020 [Microbacterium sp. 22195]|uniref:hypothetical protein n=1 Tax=Microbacterium sp. 22195 TaxID=3453891 RepID=UPI003F84C14E